MSVELAALIVKVGVPLMLAVSVIVLLVRLGRKRAEADFYRERVEGYAEFEKRREEWDAKDPMSQAADPVATSADVARGLQDHRDG